MNGQVCAAIEPAKLEVQFWHAGLGDSVTRTNRGWVIPALLSLLLVSTAVLLLLLARQPELAKAIEILTPVIVPLAVALIAWYGVSSNIRSSREQELLSQWHSNVRWATDLTLSDNDQDVATGIAVLDSLDDLVFLGDEENRLIDAIVESTADRYAEIYDS